MGSKTFYHNITKGWFNVNDRGDAAEMSEPGDIIKMSFAGNALMFDLIETDLKIELKGEYDWAREEFLKCFREFHEEEFC